MVSELEQFYESYQPDAWDFLANESEDDLDMIRPRQQSFFPEEKNVQVKQPQPQSSQRCLDVCSKFSACMCTSAPSPEEEELYELVGDIGRKNGEKRLRCLLIKTEEWASKVERDKLADICDTQGPQRARLASALRLRHVCDLRKSDLIHMARMWGYKCDVWRKKTKFPKRKQEETVVSEPPPAKKSTFDVLFGDSMNSPDESLLSHLRNVLDTVVQPIMNKAAGALRMHKFGEVGATFCPDEQIAKQSMTNRAIVIKSFTALTKSAHNIYESFLEKLKLGMTKDNEIVPAWKMFVGTEQPIETLLQNMSMFAALAVKSCNSGKLSSDMKSSPLFDGVVPIISLVSHEKFHEVSNKAHLLEAVDSMLEYIAILQSELFKFKLASNAVYQEAVRSTMSILTKHLDELLQTIKKQSGLYDAQLDESVNDTVTENPSNSSHSSNSSEDY